MHTMSIFKFIANVVPGKNGAVSVPNGLATAFVRKRKR